MKKTELNKLYMIAIMPPEDVANKIDRIRKEFAEAYHCKAALKNPVHMTLYPPYSEAPSHEEELKQILTKFAKTQPSFGLEVKGFEAFKKNGVIFIDVMKNEALKELHKGLTTLMTKFLKPEFKSKQDFHPHFTIGYRDIPKDLFSEAINDYLPRKFETSFLVDKIFFWRHTGKNWEIIASFPLKSDSHEMQISLF